MADGRPSERGIFEVADDAGNVITDFNRLRLGPGMSMYYKPEDPSCVIDAGGALVGGNSFPSISSLRSLLTLPSSSSSYSTLGYYSPGDGGGSFYTWDPVSTETDDGGSVIKLTFRAVGRMKLVLTSGRWNVRQFGAKGDNAGNNVDRDAIRAAVAVAASHAFVKKVYVPAGKYNMLHGISTAGEFPNCILLTDNIHLCGDGDASILFWPGEAPPGEIVAEPMDHSVVMIRGNNVIVSELTFQGLNGDAEGTGYRHPNDAYANYSAIDCWFVFGDPEYFDNLVIDSCKFLNLYGFVAHDVGAIQSGRFSNNYSFCCSNGENLCSYNFQHDNNTFVSSEGIETSGAKTTIIANRFSCPHGGTAGVSLTGFVSSPDTTSNSATIVANIFDCLGSIAPQAIVADTYSNASIIGNVIRNAKTAGIQLDNCAKFTVSGNTILRDRSDGASGIQFGIYAQGLTDSAINGNIVNGGGFLHFGIGVSNGVRCSYNGNTASECATADFIFAANTDITVALNQSVGSGTISGFDFQSCTNVSWIGNRTSGHALDLKIDAACVNIRSVENSYATSLSQVVLLPPGVSEGGDIPDADTTINISGGIHYLMPTATSARVITLGTAGSPIVGEEIIVDVTRTSANAVTIKDDAGTTLLTVPASVLGTVRAAWGGTHFANPRFVRIQ